MRIGVCDNRLIRFIIKLILTIEFHTQQVEQTINDLTINPICIVIE